MRIDFTPDRVEQPSAPPGAPTPDRTAWQVVPATVVDERGFTIEDYERAAVTLLAAGDDESKSLADQATFKAWNMRHWLVLQRHGVN